MKSQVHQPISHARLAASLIAALAASMAFGFSALAADDYPQRAIRLLVPFPPAGAGDMVARQLGAKLGEALGQQIVIDNRGGGGQVIATEITARATPDGYTLLLATQAHGSNPALVRKLPYDSIKDFTPITRVAESPLIFVAHPTLGVDTMPELIARAKAQPGRINYGSSGQGSAGHLAFELLKWMAGIDIVHVPYKGAAPALIDLIAGHTQVMCTSPLPTLPQVRSGKLRALAMTGRTRSRAAPAIPTVAESGVPGYQAGIWFALLAPAHTPRAIVEKLQAETVRAVRSPDMTQRLIAQGAEPLTDTPRELERFIRAEIGRWNELAQKTSIRIE